MTAPRRRLIAAEVAECFEVSQRRASRALDLPRSSLRYEPVAREEQAALARRIEELAGTHPRFGYRRIGALLDREGWSVNIKAVRRLWRLAGLKLAGPRAASKPRRPHGQDVNACHLRPSRSKDDVWTWDFLFDRTSDGRSLKWLSLVDEDTRECLAWEARRSMTAEEIRVILAAVASERGGPPHRIRSDNGPEFAAEVVRSWLEGTGSGRGTWPLRAHGRTATRSRSTASSAMSSWTVRSSRARPRRGPWAGCGRRSTICTARTVR
jgi:hypothetical protein